jgi:hypothetical protein
MPNRLKLVEYDDGGLVSGNYEGLKIPSRGGGVVKRPGLCEKEKCGIADQLL